MPDKPEYRGFFCEVCNKVKRFDTAKFFFACERGHCFTCGRTRTEQCGQCRRYMRKVPTGYVAQRSGVES